MALQTDTTLKIGENIFKNFSHLKITQKIHDHHSFTFQIRQDLLVDEFRSVMPVSNQLYGERISIEIKPIPDLDDLMVITNPKDYILQFYGVITEVEVVKSTTEDIEEIIIIKGKSTSVILDSGKECNSFTNMSLLDIVNKVKSDYEIDMSVVPFYKKNLAYTVQYNESDFDFLNRLAMRYGHWFYDTGRTLVFGSPGSSGGEPKLVYGINMRDFSYAIKLIPAQFKTIENDNRIGDYFLDNTINYRNEPDGFHQNFINKSNQVFSKETVIQLNQNSVGMHGQSSLEEYTKNKMRSAVSRMMQVNASSEIPGITLGNTVEISGVDKQLESRYTITQITHYCDDGGGYENTFTAVNFNGYVFSPETNPDLIPNCKSQTAIVTENTDPDGLSAVKVQMPWQKIKGETTPYIPLLQKYGGDARGSHILPEVGDTVYVEFQGDNAEMPIVTGTLTSRKETSGYSTPNNDLKVFRTRSGIMIVCNDADGSVLIEDPSGNKYFMDGKGNIEFESLKNITFTAGEDININAGQNMNTNVGSDKTDTVGGDHKETITGFKTLSVGINYAIKVLGSLSEYIEGNRTSQSSERKEMAKMVSLISTEEHINVHASKNLNKYSGENSTNS